LDLGSFFGKKFDCKKVPFLKFILLKNYLAPKAENVINVTKTLAEQNRKTVCKNVNQFLRYSHLKNCIFRRRRANEMAPTVQYLVAASPLPPPTGQSRGIRKCIE
jgi:D-alanyl-D-alanine dipeptidase